MKNYKNPKTNKTPKTRQVGLLKTFFEPCRFPYVSADLRSTRFQPDAS